MLKFSIVVPVHNNENTIERCVNSLLLQNEDIQIILIENGSSDDSLKRCKEISEMYKQAEVYVNETTGVSAARNKGLIYANGDIIGFCDADDYYEENILGNIAEYFEKEKADIVICGYTTVSEEGSESHFVKKKDALGISKAIDHIICDPEVMGSVCNKFYRKRLMTNMYFPEDLSYMEDTFFNVSLLSKMRSIKINILSVNSYFYVKNNLKSATWDINNSFDAEGMLKYNVSLHKMLNELDLNKKEEKSIRDKIFRLSTPWYGNPQIQDKALWRNKLYDEIKENWWIFSCRIFRYEPITRIKLLIRGLKIIINGKLTDVTVR